VASVASFTPQIHRIGKNGDCAGVLVYYLLFNFVIAAHDFTLLLAGIIEDASGFDLEELTGIWLNLTQFTFAWLNQLVLYVTSFLGV
jgi:hypothetical protein